MAGDIAAVADAAGLEKFALLGISQGCAYSVRYAVAHPERVSGLVLQGGYLHGRSKRSDPEQGRLYEMIHRSMIDGWGSPNPVFRHVFTSQYMPDAPPAVAESFDELQRVATSPENAMRLLEMMSRIDIGELAPQVRAPTLVLHSAGDRVAPYDEGRQLARAIPGASFVELPGNNHLPIAGSPAFDRFIEETTAFVRAHAA
jgi:pimeloyl-ACP methyl ester carboxylesterase